MLSAALQYTPVESRAGRSTVATGVGRSTKINGVSGRQIAFAGSVAEKVSNASHHMEKPVPANPKLCATGAHAVFRFNASLSVAETH